MESSQVFRNRNLRRIIFDYANPAANQAAWLRRYLRRVGRTAADSGTVTPLISLNLERNIRARDLRMLYRRWCQTVRPRENVKRAMIRYLSLHLLKPLYKIYNAMNYGVYDANPYRFRLTR